MTRRILFVVPAIGKKAGERYIATWKMEPLAIAVLAQLTRAHGGWEAALADDRLELVPEAPDVDLVAIAVETYTAKRSYQLADRFRARGLPVVLGGYHPTLLPDEAACHADALVIGNAEVVWDRLLDDAARGRLAPRYEGGSGARPPAPDRSIYAGKRYVPVGLEETGRGCPHHCDFCAIASYYGSAYHPRPVADVIHDLHDSGRRLHFLVDDNLVANRRYLGELLQALRKEKFKWAGQGTLSMARDPELLAALRQAGCEFILIGFESLESENLRQMKKEVNLLPDERDQLVRRIHQTGLGIYATFVIGYDHDDEASVARTLDFARQHRFYTAAFNHLLPWPGTPLYRRLEAEGRLRYERWWLADDYRYGDFAFEPKRISAERLSALCLEARRAFGRPGIFWQRAWAALRRGTPGLWYLFWAMNLNIGGEVTQKYAIPLGANLDELPK